MDNPETYFDVSFNLTSCEALPAAQVVAPAPTLGQIKALQDKLLDLSGGEQWEGDPEHYFADGMYGRVLPIKAGQCVVAKMHRHEHLVVLLSGECVISTADGMKQFSSRNVWTSKPGEKRVLVAITDCEFMTVHLNESNTRDLAEIEAYVIVPESEIDYEGAARVAADDFHQRALQGVYA